jgi:hypothetical protein
MRTLDNRTVEALFAVVAYYGDDERPFEKRFYWRSNMGILLDEEQRREKLFPILRNLGIDTEELISTVITPVISHLPDVKQQVTLGL